jgi:hypothetical protein
VALIFALQNALADGFEHYDIHGTRLMTVEAALDALLRDGSIEVKAPSS